MVYEEPVRLNAGCNVNYLHTHLNLDVDKQFKADVYADLTYGFPFKTESVNEIVLSHVLEHVSYKHGRQLINEVYRVLKKDGIFRVSTPNLKYILNCVETGNSQLNLNMLIQGTRKTEWELHHASYTIEMLRSLLKRFKDVKEVFVWHEIRLTAKK